MEARQQPLRAGGSPPQEAALARRNHELEILNAIAQALSGSVELEDLMSTALARVAELLDLDTGWVFLLHEDSGEPYLAASQNLPPALAAHPARFTGSCYCLDTFRQGDLEGAANVNVVTCSRLKKVVEGGGELRFHASIPLYARGRRLGVLNVAARQWRELGAEDLRLLHTVGDMLGLAVERARLYARSLRAGAAEERNRLAREIHDTLAQGLSAITLRLETVEALLDQGADAEQLRPAARAALELARLGLEEARRSVLDLRAAPLEGRSLAEALAALAEEAAATAGPVTVRFHPPRDRRPLPGRLEVGLYRIAQEGLANALRHAGASAVHLRLEVRPERVELKVDDDGRGMPEEAVPDGRFGLVGMRERARLLGGELAVESEVGRGTRLRVTVPAKGAP